MTALDSLLRRERVVAAIGLAVLTALAWLYIWRGAGMGMSALDMTTVALFPHTQPELMPGMAPPPMALLTVVAMWWVMMIAMMTPSAAPLVLLYTRVVRHASGSNDATDVAPLLLVSGYLAVWLAFSIVATALQFLLLRFGLISGMTFWSKSAWLSAAFLIAAGIYQLTPLKLRCLKRCRSPAHFLAKHAGSGRARAWVLGVEHGAWCVGCCWMLMALLFVGGVMNLAWIAVLALLVLAEKVLPHGVVTSRAVGAILIAWGLATLAI